MIWRGHWRQRIGVEIARAYEAPGKAEMGEPGQRDESLVDCEETESEGMEECRPALARRAGSQR